MLNRPPQGLLRLAPGLRQAFPLGIQVEVLHGCKLQLDQCMINNNNNIIII
jgi:hypothetical protein